jgi:hypothetical protein
MVRMSDLVRGPAPGPRLPAVEEEEAQEPSAPAAPPPAGRPPAARPPRLALRTLDAPSPAPPVVEAPPVKRPAVATAPVTTPPAMAPRRAAPDTPKSLFEALNAMLAGVRDNVTAGGAPSWPDVEALLGRVVASLERSAELFWLANAPTVPAGIDYLVVHQSRVAVLAARVGLIVGYDRPRAVALGIAGAFIDLGLWQSPAALLRRLDSLSADERTVYRAHPRRSAALLSQWGAPAPIVDAVLHHHEREQGQGFPQGLTGNAISQDAKILGLVDSYTGLTLPASRRPALRSHEAIREVVRSKHESFSPALIKALLSEISVFPPGTLVRLNTGEVGQVTAVNRSHPLRPRIEVVADSKGNQPLTPKTIDLSETPFLYITGPVSEPTK